MSFMNFGGFRKGPRTDECSECWWYEFYRKKYKKYRWLKEVDGRAVSHYERHLSRLTYLPQWSDMKGVMESGTIPEDEYGKECYDCNEGWMILRNYELTLSDWEEAQKKYGRHYELHQGFERFGGIYMDEWKAREDLRNAEYEFFKVMNAHHIVNTPWHWGDQPWVAVDRESGHAFERIYRMYTTKAGTFAFMRVDKGYSNNIGGYKLRGEW